MRVTKQWHQALPWSAFSLMLMNNAPGVYAAQPIVTAMPSYVLQYAPLVWTHSQDPYQPSDIASHVANIIPQIKYQPIGGAPSPLTLDNLDQLNGLGGASIFLTSKEGIRALPPWLRGTRPNSDGKTEGAVTSAIVVTERGEGVVDAFYFYFSSYNEGNTVFGIQFGNHVGDWEHNMIRFKDGAPQAIWYSQHASGQAFTWDTVDKQGLRPIAFSANGSHAVYATEGTHDHTIPGIRLPIGLLNDECNKGFLWDPTLSAYTYSYDRGSKLFRPYTQGTPVNWLYFDGQWGDEQLPDDAEGQINLFGQRKYTSGPNGPRFKELDRPNICPPRIRTCNVREDLLLSAEEERQLRLAAEEPEVESWICFKDPSLLSKYS